MSVLAFLQRVYIYIYIYDIMNIGIHIFELRNEEINVKKILAVINATYAVAKRKPEKKKKKKKRPDFFQAFFSQLHKLR